MYKSYVRQVVFYPSPSGGSLSTDEARAKAFHPYTDREEAIKEFNSLMSLPLNILNFVDLEKLYSYSPRAAEGFWEITKHQRRAEFESGHLTADVTMGIGNCLIIAN